MNWGAQLQLYNEDRKVENSTRQDLQPSVFTQDIVKEPSWPRFQMLLSMASAIPVVLVKELPPVAGMAPGSAEKVSQMRYNMIPGMRTY